MDGWIKLHRKIKSWRYYKEPSVKSVFFDLLVDAAPCAMWDDGVRLHKGEVKTSISSIMESTGLSRHTVIECLRKLEKSGEIKRTQCKICTIIKICKYNDYQDNSKKSGAKNAPKDGEVVQKMHQVVQNLHQGGAKNAPPTPISIDNKNNIKNNIIVDDERARARERLDELLSSTATVEAICKNEGVTFQEFKAAAEAVLSEWAYTEPEHTSESDARRHLLNTIRIKIRESKNKQNGTARTINGNRKAEQDQLAAGYAAVIARRLAEDDARTAKVWQP